MRIDIADELDCFKMFGPFNTMATGTMRETGTTLFSNEPLNWYFILNISLLITIIMVGNFCGV